MKRLLSRLDQEIEKYVEPTKVWLLRKGYIKKDSESGEYQWTKEGLLWINSMTKATKGERNV